MMLTRRGLILMGGVAGLAPSAMAGPILSPPPAIFDPGGELPQPWRNNAIQAKPLNGRPAISIVIDDMGVMQPGTARTIALAAPLTLSWFPFARHLPEQVAAGTARGHETTLHMPMQSTGRGIAQTGPDPLRIDIPAAENLARLRAAIDAVPHSVGINNHMGAVATLNVPLMDLVAQEARRRGLLFLDSVVIPHSIGESQARAIGVPAASRDIFLDHVPNLAAVKTQLELVERVARRTGSVIAIGHPHSWTLEALEGWLPGVEAKGLVMWPLSAMVAWRNALQAPVFA